MKRRVELRPSAEIDLDRVAKFVAKFSAPAGDRRAQAIEAFLASLGDPPLKGSPRNAKRDFYQVVRRIGGAHYVVRYRLTPDAVIVTRIWHGKEKRSK